MIRVKKVILCLIEEQKTIMAISRNCILDFYWTLKMQKMNHWFGEEYINNNDV